MREVVEKYWKQCKEYFKENPLTGGLIVLWLITVIFWTIRERQWSSLVRRMEMDYSSMKELNDNLLYRLSIEAEIQSKIQNQTTITISAQTSCLSINFPGVSSSRKYKTCLFSQILVADGYKPHIGPKTHEMT